MKIMDCFGAGGSFSELDVLDFDDDVVQGKGGRTFLLTAEGDSVPGPTLRIGTTNSRYRFPLHAREFTDRWSRAGPAHHCAIGVGHIADRLDKLSRLLGIECQRVC